MIATASQSCRFDGQKKRPAKPPQLCGWMAGL